MPILALIISMIFEDIKPDINFLTGLVVAIGGLLLIFKTRNEKIILMNNFLVYILTDLPYLAVPAIWLILSLQG